MTFINDRIMRKSEVCRLTGIPIGSIWYMMQKQGFPKAIKLGKRSIGWKKSEVDVWLASRPTA